MNGQPSIRFEFEGKAKIGEIAGNFLSIQFRPEDLSSPIAFQMAISRIYNELMKMTQGGSDKKYVAEVSFTDSLGNLVNAGVDLGNSTPPISKKEVKAKIIIELYDEDNTS